MTSRFLFPDLAFTLSVLGACAWSQELAKGAKVAELPVEQVSTFKLMVNLKTAKALGVTIPQSILLRADKVIQ